MEASKESADLKDYFLFRRESHSDLMIQMSSNTCLEAVLEYLIGITYTLELQFYYRSLYDQC